MYGELFDEKHSLVMGKLKEVKAKNASTGEFESNILCKECENKISKFESYARFVLYGGRPRKGVNIQLKHQRTADGLELTYISGLDYRMFKLFLLSLLWRASISSRPFFKNVVLGAYEEKLRKMILAEDPGGSEAYPCVLSTYRKHDLPAGVIAEPQKIKGIGTARGIGYAFLINGVLYYYFVTHKTARDWVKEAAISESGEMRLLHIPPEKSKDLLNTFFGIKMF